MPCRLVGFDNFSLRLRNSLAGFVSFFSSFPGAGALALHVVGSFRSCPRYRRHLSALSGWRFASALFIVLCCKAVLALAFHVVGLSFSWLVLANDWLDVVWLAPCFARRCLTFLVRSRLPIFSFKSFTASALRCSALFSVAV